MRLEKPSEIIHIKLKEIVVKYCYNKQYLTECFASASITFSLFFFKKNKEREINTTNFGRQMYNQ